MKSLRQLTDRNTHRVQYRIPLLASGLFFGGLQILGQGKLQLGPGVPSSLFAQALQVVTIVGFFNLQIKFAPNLVHFLMLHFLAFFTNLQIPEFGRSTAGNPKSVITHVSPRWHGTGRIWLPIVEHRAPLGKHPMPRLIQHSAASNGEMGLVHLSFLTGPKISKCDLQLAACNLHRLQNSIPLLATRRGERHSSVQIKLQLGAEPPVSVRFAQARQVATTFWPGKPLVAQRALAPFVVQYEMVQVGGLLFKAVHFPTRGPSAAGLPKSESTQISPVLQGIGRKPPRRHFWPGPTGGWTWAEEKARRESRIVVERMDMFVLWLVGDGWKQRCAGIYRVDRGSVTWLCLFADFKLVCMGQILLFWSVIFWCFEMTDMFSTLGHDYD